MMKFHFIAKAAALAAVFVSALSVAQAQSELSVEQRLSHLEQLAQTRNKVQADQAFQINELQREVRELRGILEEHEFKLRQIQDRQRDLYRELENRLSAQAAPTRSQPAPQTAISSPTVATTTAPATTTADNPRAEFEAAFALVRGKQYDEAIKAFQSFLKKYPQGQFSDNAQFWIGQVYYAQGKTEQAITEFKQMLTLFPDSPKTASAMLKLGDIYFKQQAWDQARAMYQKVANQYKGTQQQLARKGLDKLKAAGH